MVRLVRQGGGLADQASERAQVDEEIGAGDVGGGASQAVGPEALEVQGLQLAVAAFGGVAATAVARFPGGRADGEEAGQAGVSGAVRMAESRGHVLGHPTGALWITVRAFRRGLCLG